MRHSSAVYLRSWLLALGFAWQPAGPAALASVGKRELRPVQAGSGQGPGPSRGGGLDLVCQQGLESTSLVCADPFRLRHQCDRSSCADRDPRADRGSAASCVGRAGADWS